MRVKRKYRFHIPGMVHLPMSERYMGCAFTQKIVKLSKMMLSLGHEVYLYGVEGTDAPCTEFIETHTLKDVRNEWGEGDNRSEIGYNWRVKGFKHDINKPVTKTRAKFYENSQKEINKRKRKDDFFLNMQGSYNKPIGDAVKLFLSCEPGIGYRGSYMRFRAFESSYIQNFTYGSEHPRKAINGYYYHRVIPNYFDPKDFSYSSKKEDYYFFIGRIINRKGIDTAVKVCQHLGKKLIIAGQDDEYKIPKDPLIEYVGYVEPEERTKLMKHARAVFVPTKYLEPFAGVHIESMICGTPVITTNFGVFPDTVICGVNGYRCDTLNDFVIAAKAVKSLSPAKIRATSKRFLMDNVRYEFNKWFDDLYQVYLSAEHPGKVKGWFFVEGDSKRK